MARVWQLDEGRRARPAEYDGRSKTAAARICLERPPKTTFGKLAANGELALFRRRADFAEHGAHLTTEARQDAYEKDRNKCGYDAVFDRGRGSFVTKEILTCGSHFHNLFLTNRPTPAAGPSSSLALWAKIWKLSLTATRKTRVVCRMPIFKVNETLVLVRRRYWISSWDYSSRAQLVTNSIVS